MADRDTRSEADPPLQPRSTEEILEAAEKRDIEADARDKRANDRDARRRMDDFVIGGRDRLADGGGENTTEMREARTDRLAAEDDRILAAYDRAEMAQNDEPGSSEPK